MGSTFSHIIYRQFLRIREGDWRWFENFQLNNILTGDEVRFIANTTFKDIITAVTKIEPYELQSDVFNTRRAVCVRNMEFTGNGRNLNFQ